MKNLVSFISVVFVFMFISGCGTKYARPDRCVCESVHAKVEQNLEKDVYQEEDNVNEQEDFTVEEDNVDEQEEVTIQEKDNAVSQALQEAVKNNDKEFTLDFEKVANQSLFESGSDKISQDTYESLNIVASFLKENPEVTVRIEGHTDSTGSKVFNQKLSENRAKSTAKYLIEQGVEKTRISTKGYGPSKPIATNETKEGRAKNRRTELKFKIGDAEHTQIMKSASGSTEIDRN